MLSIANLEVAEFEAIKAGVGYVSVTFDFEGDRWKSGLNMLESGICRS